jgi:hypothetical protein
MDSRFSKANWLSFRWRGLPLKIKGYPRKWIMYARMANAAELWLPFISICWRMPWAPEAAYSMGWDACFRQMSNQQAAGRGEGTK